MQAGPNFYVSLIYLLAAAPYAWLGLFVWRKRPAVAVTPFAWAMLGLSIWSFAYGLELFFPSLAAKTFLTKIGYMGVVSVPVFLLFFSLEYTGKSHLLTPRIRLVTWVVPVLCIFSAWTNDVHNAVWDSDAVVRINDLQLLTVSYRPFFWIQTIYSNALIVFACIVLVMEMMQRPRLYRIHLIVFGLGILLAGNLFFISKINPIPGLNITPLLFLPAALALTWAIVRHRMLEILPLEHLTVLKNIKDGIIVVNPDRRILYVNPLVESLFGRTETDVIGQPLNYIFGIHGEKLASHVTGLDHQVEMTIGEGIESRIFEVTVSSLDTPQKMTGSNAMIILHDITGRKKAEAELSMRETIMSAISLAAERFLRESSWQQHIPGILEKIGRALKVSRVYVFMNYLDERNVVHSSQCYEWSAPGVVPQIDNPNLQHVNLRQAGFSRWEERLSKGESIHGLLRDFPDSEKALLREQHILSLVLMPIFVEDQWWGFIGFDECAYERRWQETEIEVLHITANIFGSAETRARIEQRLLRRQQNLNHLQEIVSEVLRARTLQQMATYIVDRLAKLVNADECFITVWDETNSQAFPLATNSTSMDMFLPLRPVLGGKTLTELALRLGHVLIVEDVHSSPYFEHEIAGQCPSQSLVVSPLIVPKNKLGAIILAFKSYRRFQPEEILICEQASHLIELAFEKFKVMEQAQQRAATSETLRKAGAAITETLETNEAITRILDHLKQVIPYDTASVQLLNGGELEIVGGSGFANPKFVIGMRFAIPGDNPNSVVVETGRPYLLSKVGDVYSEFKKPPHSHIKSWLGVPLIAQDRLIGLLAVDSIKENHFTDDDISVAAAFADQVSIALENARIFKATQDQALTDPLTGLYNRRGLFDLAKADFLRSIASGQPIAGIMIDLDHFKNINDTYGHDTGDRVLFEVAKRCKNGVRGLDYVGRYGGEEFLVILPETNIKTGVMVAERLRKVIAATPISVGEGLELKVTASLGVSQRDENTTTLEMMITRADQAMYVAKHKGRNGVAVST